MSLYIFPDTTLLGTANTWTQGQSFIAASGSSVITIGNTGSSGTTCTITGQDFGGLPWLAINTGTNNLSFATITTGGAVPKQFTFTSDAAFGIQDASQTASLSVQLAANSSVTLTANRKLTFDVVNAARTIKLAGNLDIANNFTTAGNFPLTLTTTASTSVTLPTSGTLLTTSGSGSSLTFGTGTLSLAGNLTTSGAFATTLTVTGTTTVTLPTSGTLLTTTGSETVTGNIYTSGWLEAGRTSGSVALTTNDGYGNANIAFNHKSGTPDLTGNSGRITVNVDATSGVSMGFQLKSTTTLGVAVGLTQVLTLDELTATFATKTVSSGTVQGTQLISTIATGTAPLSVASTTQVANLNASQLAGNSVGTSGAAIPLCNTANTFSANNTFSGLNSTFGSNTGAATYGLGSGATLTATTKTINIGTGGVAGSITNINIGSQTSDTTNNIYGNIIQNYDIPSTTGAPFPGVTNFLQPQAGIVLSTVTVDVTTAIFTCAAATLSVGQAMVLSGTNTGALITGYSNPTTYYIISTNTTTTFSLSTTPGGASIALTGVSGSTGLTFSTSTGATAFGTTESPFISAQTFLGLGVVPYLWLSSGGKSNSFVTISTANNAYTWSFNNAGVFTAAGNITTPGQLISTIATGTAPLSVTSTTVVPNLNASLLSGNAVGTSGAAIPLLNANNTFSGVTSFTNSIKMNSTTAVAGTYNTSAVQLQSNGSTGNTVTGYTIGMWGAIAGGPAIEFVKGRNGTIGTTTGVTNVLVAGDTIAQVIASGFDATTVNNLLKESSAIRMTVSATPTVGFTPGKIAFWTSGTASASASRVEINHTGLLSAFNGITVSGATTTLTTGTATVAPITFASGTNLTTAAAGVLEYDGSFFYATKETTSGRGNVSVDHTFRLAANGTAITTIANFYGANSAINLAASAVYDIEYHAYFTKTTAGTVTFTLTASSAPTLMFALLQGTPATGVGAGTPQSLSTAFQANVNAAFGATASLSTGANHVYLIKGRIQTNLATNLRLNLTSNTGSATPLAGSYYVIRRVSATQGSFAA